MEAWLSFSLCISVCLILIFIFVLFIVPVLILILVPILILIGIRSLRLGATGISVHFFAGIPVLLAVVSVAFAHIFVLFDIPVELVLHKIPGKDFCALWYIFFTCVDVVKHAAYDPAEGGVRQ